MSRDIPTFRISTCEHCNQPIAEVRDPHSGVLDWYSNGGDFGCGMSPDCTGDAVGGHEPRLTGAMTDWWESRMDPGSAWVHTEHGTLQAQEVLQIKRVFTGRGVTGMLRIEVDRCLLVSEGPAELFHAILDLPPLVLVPGQMIELIGEGRSRVPCTWLVTRKAEGAGLCRPIQAPSQNVDPADPFSLPEGI